MKRLFFSLLIIAALCSQSYSQTDGHSLVSAEKPETVGMSSKLLGRIDELVMEYVKNKWIAGAAAIVVKEGNIVYYKGIGLDDIEKGTPLKKDAIFRIASQTKAITSVGVMMLYEEGKILLDDPVSQYIP